MFSYQTPRLLIIMSLLLGLMVSVQAQTVTYPIVDTDLHHCFSDQAVITCGQSNNGQDGQYDGLQFAYQNNGDGTITDLNTGLMWQADPVAKTSYAEAVAGAANFNLAGYTDWRLPSIKEIYSLMSFSGLDGSSASDTSELVAFIDEDYFTFYYGDTNNNERLIDSQWTTSNVYIDNVMNNQECFFGVNFADGRIKCYPTQNRGNGYFTIYVRGNESYGINNFADNGNGSITDNATGLTWMQSDSGSGMLWGDALNYCEGLSFAGADDWRLPNIKELHSIVDYTRSPSITNSAAIDPLFTATQITNEGGQVDYAFYWSSTTHIGYPSKVDSAAYISFGLGLGNMDEFGGWIDVHGAGAQRSDPKSGVSADEIDGHGPQGDARRATNYVRCVRGGTATPSNGADPSTLNLSTANGPQGQPPAGGNDQSGGQNQQPPAGGNNQSGGQGGPPPEAFTACEGIAQNATCSVNTPNGTLTGTCQSMDSGLACVPNR